MAKADGVSTDMARFLDGLSAEEREGLLEVLRDSRTYLAEDMNDVIAILQDIEN
jgi:hypothetical protein